MGRTRIALFVLAAALAAPASAQAAPCTKPGDTVLRATADVVLIRRGTSRYLVCDRPSGHRREIGNFSGGSKPPRLLRVAGEWVGYVAEYCDEGKYDFPVVCEPVVEVVRARDGRNSFRFVPVDSVSDLILCADRKVIGLGAGPGNTRRAFSLSGLARRVLADTPVLDLHSLERRGARASWTQGTAGRGTTACTSEIVRSIVSASSS